MKTVHATTRVGGLDVLYDARDVAGAEVHLLDAGHFALDECADEIARPTRSFMERLA